MKKHFWISFSCIWANSWERFVSKDLVYFAGKWPPQNCFYGVSESLEACLYGCTCWADLENHTLQSCGPNQRWGRKKARSLVNRLLAGHSSPKCLQFRVTRSVLLRALSRTNLFSCFLEISVFAGFIPVLAHCYSVQIPAVSFFFF